MCDRYTLFRRLRSTCDLLMMPKEVLTDRHIREEVVPGLSVHKIMAILERFHPDDYAPESLPHGAALVSRGERIADWSALCLRTQHCSRMQLTLPSPRTAQL